MTVSSPLQPFEARVDRRLCTTAPRPLPSATLQDQGRLRLCVCRIRTVKFDILLTSFSPTDIAQCAKVLRETASDEGLAPIPIFGNGDAYDYRTYYENMGATGVDGIMIARGALIKVSLSCG